MLSTPTGKAQAAPEMTTSESCATSRSASIGNQYEVVFDPLVRRRARCLHPTTAIQIFLVDAISWAPHCPDHSLMVYQSWKANLPGLRRLLHRFHRPSSRRPPIRDRRLSSYRRPCRLSPLSLPPHRRSRPSSKAAFQVSLKGIDSDPSLLFAAYNIRPNWRKTSRQTVRRPGSSNSMRPSRLLKN